MMVRTKQTALRIYKSDGNFVILDISVKEGRCTLDRNKTQSADVWPLTQHMSPKTSYSGGGTMIC